MRGIRCESGAVPQLYGESRHRTSLTKRWQGDELSQSAACFLFVTSLARYKMARSRPRSLGCRLAVPIFMEGYVFFLCRVFCWSAVKGGDGNGVGKAEKLLERLASR